MEPDTDDLGLEAAGVKVDGRGYIAGSRGFRARDLTRLRATIIEHRNAFLEAWNGHFGPEQRANWRLIGRGEGVHWPDIDEDVSVNALLGLPS
jgi:hypothetical protein